MKFNIITGLLVFAIGLAAVGCGGEQAETAQRIDSPPAPVPSTTPEVIDQPQEPALPEVPNLQREIMSEGKGTSSPIGAFNFKNFSYDMPRGWENPDGSQITLAGGKIAPVSIDINEDMTPEEKAARKAQRRIGLSYVTTKYLDATGDGVDEALVVLKIETGGAAVPQVVYLFEWRSGKPEKLWFFRTGDRADGGLKNILVENGMLIVELYGQDRFILGGVETGKITGDEEQLCCPTHFTRSTYKWNGSTFLMQGKRLTYSINDPLAAPLENHGDIMNDPVKSKKYLNTPQPAR